MTTEQIKKMYTNEKRRMKTKAQRGASRRRMISVTAVTVVTRRCHMFCSAFIDSISGLDNGEYRNRFWKMVEAMPWRRCLRSTL